MNSGPCPACRFELANIKESTMKWHNRGAVVVDEAGFIVAPVYGHGPVGISTEEQEKMARLIAAAPQLLEACEAFVEAWMDNYASAADMGDVLRKVEQAIAAAKGGYDGQDV